MTLDVALQVHDILHSAYSPQYTVRIKKEDNAHIVIIEYAQERFAACVRHATTWHIENTMRTIAKWN